MKKEPLPAPEAELDAEDVIDADQIDGDEAPKVQEPVVREPEDETIEPDVPRAAQPVNGAGVPGHL